MRRTILVAVIALAACAGKGRSGVEEPAGPVGGGQGAGAEAGQDPGSEDGPLAPSGDDVVSYFGLEIPKSAAGTGLQLDCEPSGEECTVLPDGYGLTINIFKPMACDGEPTPDEAKTDYFEVVRVATAGPEKSLTWSMRGQPLEVLSVGPVEGKDFSVIGFFQQASDGMCWTGEIYYNTGCAECVDAAEDILAAMR